MINLGHKIETILPVAEGKPPKPSNEMMYPSLSLYDVKDLPLTDKDAGKKFTITAEVIVRRVSKTADKEGKRDEACLDFVSIEFGKRKGKERFSQVNER